MIKPWSITTTLRNPERLRNFLKVLKQIENLEWNLENQKKYQILLIQNRMYGFGSNQFYSGLSQEIVDLINNQSQKLSYEKAEEIFKIKNYEDPAMRGRQSINPLKKFGFVIIKDKKIKITELGNQLLKDDFDFGEIFFNVFLKWQIPNPLSNDFKTIDGYNIKPFIGVLHLINSINQKEKKRGNFPKGISKNEFSLFVPTLINFEAIDIYANKIIHLREELKDKNNNDKKEIFENYKKKHINEFLKVNDDKSVIKLLKNLKDYGDNTIRYFRLTRYIHIRGNGFYIDLEPRRKIEINALLNFDSSEANNYKSDNEYLSYLADINKPDLPWETSNLKIISGIIKDIRNCESKLEKEKTEIEDYKKMQIKQQHEYLQFLRKKRQELENEITYNHSSSVKIIESYIEKLENIFNMDNRPILLEKLSTLGLYALNDAKNIKPNYPVGDDNEPTFTAPGSVPDIECFYERFNAICEVTMLCNRDQWFNEGQPVMRHLRDFEKKHKDKPAYCLFIAPSLHRDTINTFWTAVKYEYEGLSQKIIPITIKQFILILKTLISLKSKGFFLSHIEIEQLYEKITKATATSSNSKQWIENISNIIKKWESNIIQKN